MIVSIFLLGALLIATGDSAVNLMYGERSASQRVVRRAAVAAWLVPTTAVCSLAFVDPVSMLAIATCLAAPSAVITSARHGIDRDELAVREATICLVALGALIAERL